VSSSLLPVAKQGVEENVKYNPKLKLYTAGKQSWDKNLYTLDVGCGFPNPEEPYHKRGHVGLDRKRGYADVVADAHYLPFRDSTFDLIGVHTALDHFNFPLQALREINRVTKKYIVVSNANSNFWAYSFSVPPPDHSYQWNSWTLAKLLTKAGFEPIEYGYEHLGRKSSRTRVFELFVKILVGFIRKKNFLSFLNNVLIIKAVKR
jgi:SAM-dependent methyltransferase